MVGLVPLEGETPEKSLSPPATQVHGEKAASTSHKEGPSPEPAGPHLDLWPSEL